MATFVVLCRAALRSTAESLRHPAMCVTGAVRVPIQSRAVIQQPRHTPAYGAFCCGIAQSLFSLSRSTDLRV
jgi:hypothetical protein